MMKVFPGSHLDQVDHEPVKEPVQELGDHLLPFAHLDFVRLLVKVGPFGSRTRYEPGAISEAEALEKCVDR